MSAAEVLPGAKTAGGFKERRGSARFHIERAVRCKSGTGVPRYGRTVDISSSGVSFTIEELPPLGRSVELTIDWPVLLRDRTPLKLVLFGRVVRHGPKTAVITITRHEFRTLGSRGLFSRTGS
jgi:hypothetical protein